LSLVLTTSLFFNDTSPTYIYTLSLHDALPISQHRKACFFINFTQKVGLVQIGFCNHQYGLCLFVHRNSRKLINYQCAGGGLNCADRKSTRLNSSHVSISYAVFCLKKKTNIMY